MKEYTKIPVRPEEHERLVALTFALVGKIDSYLTKPSYSDVIKHLLDHYEGIQTMNSDTYYIDEQMLGDEADEQDARRMVELLSELGYNVEYGHALGQDEQTIGDGDFDNCLEIISREKYAR